MNNEKLLKIIQEFIDEKHIGSYEEKKSFSKMFGTAIQFFEEITGVSIDYEEDLVSRQLLKDYVFYDYYHMIPLFLERYSNELTRLQFKYNSTSLQ